MSILSLPLASVSIEPPNEELVSVGDQITSVGDQITSVGDQITAPLKRHGEISARRARLMRAALRARATT